MVLYIIALRSHRVTMGIMGFMEIIRTNTTQKDICINPTIIIMKTITKYLLICLLTSCSLAPGMHMSEGIGDEIYIESLDQNINIERLESETVDYVDSTYRIGNGDQISITIWGLPEIFPITNISSDQNLRRVDSKGNIYFPFVGLIKANSLTQDELRSELTEKLSLYFNEPQVDVSISRFNSQKVYLLGEVITPKKLNLTDIPLSLSDALGEVNGLNNNTSDGGKIFVIRQGVQGGKPKIILADLSSPSGFLKSSNFYLQNNDIIYVNAKGTTRWNRVISQFFPFSTFLNSVDNLTSD